MNFIKNLYEFRNKHHRIMPPFIVKIPVAFAINKKAYYPGDVNTSGGGRGRKKRRGPKTSFSAFLIIFENIS